MTEQVCPVCQGRGTVQPGFYQASPGMVVTLGSCAREGCLRCKGLGTIPVQEYHPELLRFPLSTNPERNQAGEAHEP